MEKANPVEPDEDDGDHLKQPPVLGGEPPRAETLPTSQVPAKEMLLQNDDGKEEYF